jgi:hypothetical protein
MDKNTRTPVQAPHFYPEGAKFDWFSEKMNECMPWTGGYQTCIDSIGSNSHTEKSLLEETASWQWILNQPVKHKYLPKELVPPEIAHLMAGYGFEEYQEEQLPPQEKELQLGSDT